MVTIRFGKLNISYGMGRSPKYFGLSAIDIEQLFEVEYLNERNRFNLHETDLPLIGPLLEATIEGVPRHRSVVDPLALELQHLAGEKIWISIGSGGTAYNFYVPSRAGDAIVLGVYEDGRIWTDMKALGDETADRLASELSSLGIELDTSKEWQFWRRGTDMLDLEKEDPLEIAIRVVSALFPETAIGIN